MAHSFLFGTTGIHAGLHTQCETLSNAHMPRRGMLMIKKFLAFYNAEALQKGLPYLHIESAYSQGDVGQFATRIETFLELVQKKKRQASMW